MINIISTLVHTNTYAKKTEVAHSKNHSHLLDAKSPGAKKSFSQSRTARARRRFSSLPDGKQTTKQTEKRVTYTNVADFLQ